MKKKIAKIFQTRPEKESSYGAIFNNLDVRGKIDQRHLIKTIALLFEELDKLKTIKDLDKKAIERLEKQLKKLMVRKKTK